MQDPNDPDWKVVIDVEPRARRVKKDSTDERLSAPGRADATVNFCRSDSSSGRRGEFVTKPVRNVDVAHVMADAECDEEAAHADMDFDEVQNGEADDNDDHDEESQRPVPFPLNLFMF